MLTDLAREELDLEAERFWVMWKVLELWATPGEGRLLGEQCERSEEPWEEGAVLRHLVRFWALTVWLMCFRGDRVFWVRKQLAIPVKTRQLHELVVIRSLMPLSCRPHPHAGRTFICELMVPRTQREFNQRSDAPCVQPQDRMPRALIRCVYFAKHFGIYYLKLREQGGVGSEVPGALGRYGLLLPMLVAPSKVTGRSPASHPVSCAKCITNS